MLVGDGFWSHEKICGILLWDGGWQDGDGGWNDGGTMYNENQKESIVYGPTTAKSWKC